MFCINSTLLELQSPPTRDRGGGYLSCLNSQVSYKLSLCFNSSHGCMMCGMLREGATPQVEEMNNSLLIFFFVSCTLTIKHRKQKPSVLMLTLTMQKMQFNPSATRTKYTPHFMRSTDKFALENQHTKYTIDPTKDLKGKFLYFQSLQLIIATSKNPIYIKGDLLLIRII